MHKVSRTLLLAGVLAFGTLTAACGDKVEIIQPTTPVGITSVTVSPANATILAGTSIQLSGSVVGSGAALTLAWTSSNPTVASVDATGKVTGNTAGTVTIIATSTADATKSGAAAIVVTAQAPVTPPQISINSVTQGGNPVNLTNTAGQIDVTLNISNTSGGAGAIEVFLSTSCTTNTIAASDVAVATQTVAAGQTGQVTLSINTAQLTAANAPRFANGNYCIKTRLTSGTQSVVATNNTAITLANTNQFLATVQFNSKTGRGNNAPFVVSSSNGLNYNEGDLVVTLNPVLFTSTQPAALISGYLTRNGEQAGVAPSGLGNALFTNVAVTGGTATVTFTDTGSTAGVRSIFAYQSLPVGDTLYITAITDAAGNQIAVTPTPGFPGFAIVTGAGGARQLRIDNDAPTLAGSYVVTTGQNGYINGAYAFSSGTGGAASTDTKAGVPGVGGVTTTYYVGAPNAAGFATANSCSIAGLTAVTSGSQLDNTNNDQAYDAKVIVRDALGNQICTDIASSFGPAFFFGVDKIAPEASYQTTTVGTVVGAAASTGYNTTTRGFVLAYRDSISGFSQVAGASPFTGTLRRNFYNTPSAADCVVGTFVAATGACNSVQFTTTNVPSLTFATSTGSTFISMGFNMSNGTLVPGYYTSSLTATDLAGNATGPLVRDAAFDPTTTPPAVAAPTQAGTAVSLGTATVNAAATDNLNLTTTRGNLTYPGLVTFTRVSGNVLGTFGQFVTSGTATVTLSNVYRGMQDGSTGTISGAVVAPAATVTVTDIGTNTATSTATTLLTTTAATAIHTGRTVTLASSAANGTAGASVASTNLTFQISGMTADPTFQSQPFAQVDVYKLTTSTGEYALVGTVSGATVVDNPGTGVRTYSYVASGVALSPSTTATATNTFLVIGRNAAGDAVRSPTVTQTNAP